MDLLKAINDDQVDRLKGRLFGIWRGTVTNVNDPLGLGRIKAKVHELLGDDEETDWASYCSPFGGGGHGWFFLPSPATPGAQAPQSGDGVWIMFEAGDINRPVWVGFWFNQTDMAPLGASKDVRVLETKSGHRLEFHDAQGQEKVVIKDMAGQTVTLDCSKSEIKVTANQKVIVEAPQVELGEGAQDGVLTSKTWPSCFFTGEPATALCSQNVKAKE